jgi:hypothetical protein
VIPARSHAADDDRSQNISRHALIAALHPCADRFERWVRDNEGAIDWRWLLERAQAHKVAALLAARLDGCELFPLVDPDVQPQLREARRHAAENNDTAQRTLEEVAEVLTRADVPFLLVKGLALTERVYHAPDLRSFEDLDLLVPAAAVAPAEAAARSLGYRLGQVRQLLGGTPREGEEGAAEAATRRFYERFHYELPFVPDARSERLPIDVHWRLAPASHLRATEDELWQQTEEVALAGLPVRTLNPAATLIHLAVHAVTCSLAGFKLLPLCDVAWALHRFADDYGDVWKLAGAWRAEAQLAAVLLIVERVLGTPVPESLRGARPALPWRPGFGHVATESFLVDHRGTSDLPGSRRRRAELSWNLAMRCLRYNVTRSLGVRLARLQWRVNRSRKLKAES